jgi:hypothetical protein
MNKMISGLALAAGALLYALPANAASARLHQPAELQAAASQDLEASSHRRHWRRAHVNRVVVYPRRYRSSFAYYDPGFGYGRSYYASPTYVGSPFFYGGGPYPYDSYAYAPGPYIGHRWGPSFSVGFGFGGPGLSFW